MDCRAFRDRIYHFQADEIPDAERGEFQAHLDACAECARVLEFEDGFLRVLEARIPRESAPPGLETRIRAALRAEAPSPRRLAWYRSPWFAAAAAVVLLVLLIVPTLDGPWLDPRDGAAGAVQIASRELVLVDLECDRAGRTLEQQRRCNHPHHVNALKTAEGNYWNISPDQTGYGRLVHDPELRGRRMMIDGVYYPGINTLHIDESRTTIRDVL
jgi:mycothiol system anti-sigma-R factor